MSYNSKPHRFGYGQRPNALPDKEQLKQSWWDRHDELTRSQHLTYE